jgi:hypothetical protein
MSAGQRNDQPVGGRSANQVALRLLAAVAALAAGIAAVVIAGLLVRGVLS